MRGYRLLLRTGALVIGVLLGAVGSAPAQFALNPSTGNLNFGYVLVGQGESKSVSVTNKGKSSLSGSFSTPSGSSEFSGSSSSFKNLKNGASAGNSYSFAPTSTGAVTSNIKVTANGSSNPITLSGTGVAPVNQVVVGNEQYTRIGTSSNPLVSTVTIKNTGNGDLSGLSGTIANLNGSFGSVSKNNFSLSTAKFSIPDSSSRVFSYSYTPTAHQIDSTSLTVQFNNGSSDGKNTKQSVTVTLQGQGVGPVYQSSYAPGSTIDFGDVSLGHKAKLPMTLTNVSTDPNGGNKKLTDLTLLYAITGPDAKNYSIADAKMFTVNGVKYYTVLDEGQSDTAKIIFAPPKNTTQGEKYALLTVKTDVGSAFESVNGLAYTYHLQGMAVAPAPPSLLLAGLGTGLSACLACWRRWRQGRAT